MIRTASRVVAAVTIAAGGLLHYRLWHDDGYRHTFVREMFVANIVASAVVTVALLVPRAIRLSALGGVLLALGSLAAFFLSRGPGLPTLHGTWKETGLQPAGDKVFGVKVALVVIVVEAVASTACSALLGLGVRRSRRTAA
jgi:hypothetical protein